MVSVNRAMQQRPCEVGRGDTVVVGKRKGRRGEGRTRRGGEGEEEAQRDSEQNNNEKKKQINDIGAGAKGHQSNQRHS